MTDRQCCCGCYSVHPITFVHLATGGAELSGFCGGAPVCGRCGAAARAGMHAGHLHGRCRREPGSADAGAHNLQCGGVCGGCGSIRTDGGTGAVVMEVIVVSNPSSRFSSVVAIPESNQFTGGVMCAGIGRWHGRHFRGLELVLSHLLCNEQHCDSKAFIIQSCQQHQCHRMPGPVMRQPTTMAAARTCTACTRHRAKNDRKSGLRVASIGLPGIGLGLTCIAMQPASGQLRTGDCRRCPN